MPRRTGRGSRRTCSYLPRLEGLEDRRVLSAGLWGASPPLWSSPSLTSQAPRPAWVGGGDAASKQATVPPASAVGQNVAGSQGGLGSLVRGWTHDGTHGQDLANLIHQAQGKDSTPPPGNQGQDDSGQDGHGSKDTGSEDHKTPSSSQEDDDSTGSPRTKDTGHGHEDDHAPQPSPQASASDHAPKPDPDPAASLHARDASQGVSRSSAERDRVTPSAATEQTPPSPAAAPATVSPGTTFVSLTTTDREPAPAEDAPQTTSADPERAPAPESDGFHSVSEVSTFTPSPRVEEASSAPAATATQAQTTLSGVSQPAAAEVISHLASEVARPAGPTTPASADVIAVAALSIAEGRGSTLLTARPGGVATQPPMFPLASIPLPLALRQVSALAAPSGGAAPLTATELTSAQAPLPSAGGPARDGLAPPPGAREALRPGARSEAPAPLSAEELQAPDAQAAGLVSEIPSPDGSALGPGLRNFLAGLVDQAGELLPRLQNALVLAPTAALLIAALFSAFLARRRKAPLPGVVLLAAVTDQEKSTDTWLPGTSSLPVEEPL